jgi:hypothetical protein
VRLRNPSRRAIGVLHLTGGDATGLGCDPPPGYDAGGGLYALVMPVLGVPTGGSGGLLVDLKTTFGGQIVDLGSRKEIGLAKDGRVVFNLPNTFRELVVPKY